MMTLLDCGATCSGMPEEIALSIIEHAAEAVRAKRYDAKSHAYPVVRMYKYDVPPTIDGIAAGKRIQVRYDGML